MDQEYKHYEYCGRSYLDANLLVVAAWRRLGVRALSFSDSFLLTCPWCRTRLADWSLFGWKAMVPLYDKHLAACSKFLLHKMAGRDLDESTESL